MRADILQKTAAVGASLKKKQAISKTRLELYAPYLDALTQRYDKKPPVVVGGHAMNYWLEKYQSRFADPEFFRPRLGKDLDLLVSPKIVVEQGLNNDSYEPPAVFSVDLLYFMVRRFFLRQRITPLCLWFILRNGKIRIPVPHGKKAMEIDFFSHSLGYHPSYVRRRSVKVSLEEKYTLHVMDPVQNFWQYIANAATLDQKMGDNAPRSRKDHLRVALLVPVIREYFHDLAIAAPSSKEKSKQLHAALADLAQVVQRRETCAVREQLQANWRDMLPESLIDWVKSDRVLFKHYMKICAYAERARQKERFFQHRYPQVNGVVDMEKILRASSMPLAKAA